ncbi:phage holin family protein [Glycomyces dulcitolivorans]|uniref:phage holin family protein n=1 Tax=Glycomyces dulcitolivorans TaxID=2200759 RepID=UPI000DD4B2A3|nr:phage holin family protein [Glycomyces dulcitolivorans]
MRDFDTEIEKAVNRAGRTAGWMFAIGVLTLLVGIFASFGTYGFAFVAALPGAGLMFALGVIINLQGMQLMETWRQGRRSEGNAP